MQWCLLNLHTDAKVDQHAGCTAQYFLFGQKAAQQMPAPCLALPTAVLKVPVASLLSCIGSLVVTERHTWVQQLGWCELVLCADCMQSDLQQQVSLAWYADCGVGLLVNFLDYHHNGLRNYIQLNLKPCPQ